MKSSSKSLLLGLAAIICMIIVTVLFTWGATIAFVKLITMCFGMEFTIAKATGVWLALILLKVVFSFNISFGSNKKGK